MSNSKDNNIYAAAKLLQLSPTLCNPIDGSPPGSAIPGILQARTLEWVAISFSNAWKWKVKMKLLSRVRLFATPWTAAYQAPPSMGFSRQEYWSGVPLPSPITSIDWSICQICLSHEFIMYPRRKQHSLESSERCQGTTLETDKGEKVKNSLSWASQWCTV